MYEGPVHNNSVGGKMLRDEKPDEWKPLYAIPPAAPTVQPVGVCGNPRNACGLPCEPCEGKPDPEWITPPAQPVVSDQIVAKAAALDWLLANCVVEDEGGWMRLLFETNRQFKEHKPNPSAWLAQDLAGEAGVEIADTTPPAAPVQEPKMYEDWYDSSSCGHCGMVNGHGPECRHNYKTPAQPAPVPLTDEQIVDTFCKAPRQTQYVAWFAAGVRYAEAHHGITKGQQ
jgi:hypothetical protein